MKRRNCAKYQSCLVLVNLSQPLKLLAMLVLLKVSRLMLGYIGGRVEPTVVY